MLSDGEACWIEGNATPFGMYAKLYRHRDQFVVIDDVDALYADRSGVRLLKCLCQTEEEKAVAWHSDARSLERHASLASSPRESRRHHLQRLADAQQERGALQDRGHVLLFHPSASEVHAQPGKWFDPRRFIWFAANLHRARGVAQALCAGKG